MNKILARIQGYLADLYPPDLASQTRDQVIQMVTGFRRDYADQRLQGTGLSLSQADVILITYGDQFQTPGQPPLKTLADFYQRVLAGFISTIHILPFYPYSSDDGFSVINYRQVDPKLGSWSDIAALEQHCYLMFDAVINHISSQSAWFQGFLKGETPYTDYFITVDPGTDLSAVIRPRTLPLLTLVETSRGLRHVWTTFSADQMDLNYANPQVLLEVLAILLFYIERGASMIRLDAIAFLWKEIGTSCIHLPQTHQVIKLMRAVLDLVAPDVVLISETNVPHEENISYFGSPIPQGETPGVGMGRGDEAQMVYQFPLGPLVLHSFLTGDARILSEWAAGLTVPYPTAMFFNIIASHDGIGVRPVEGILSAEEVQALVKQTLSHGGKVSYKTNTDGSRSVYELNITLYDLLNDPAQPNPALDIQRFMASQVIMLSLAGIPGIYVHSLFGSPNCLECVQESGRARSINRSKFQVEELVGALADPISTTAQVFTRYTHLLTVRREHPAFHPLGTQKVIEIQPQIFGLVRISPNQKEKILCLVNVSEDVQAFTLQPSIWGADKNGPIHDLLAVEAKIVPENMSLSPYQACWLTVSQGKMRETAID